MIYLKQIYNSNHELIEEHYIYKNALEEFIDDVNFYKEHEECISDFHENFVEFERQGRFITEIIELRLLYEKK